MNFDSDFTEVPEGPIINILSLVQIMAWLRAGDKPLIYWHIYASFSLNELRQKHFCANFCFEYIITFTEMERLICTHWLHSKLLWWKPFWCRLQNNHHDHLSISVLPIIIHWIMCKTCVMGSCHPNPSIRIGELPGCTKWKVKWNRQFVDWISNVSLSKGFSCLVSFTYNWIIQENISYMQYEIPQMSLYVVEYFTLGINDILTLTQLGMNGCILSTRAIDVLWPLLLTWFNFNPSMDK